eukprot:2597669-Amphidinium_carterae.1
MDVCASLPSGRWTVTWATDQKDMFPIKTPSSRWTVWLFAIHERIKVHLKRSSGVHSNTDRCLTWL